MIDKQLLNILVCPKDHTPLSLADDKLVASLNRAIAAGQISNVGGRAVTQQVSGALVRQDRAVLYPIVDDIPVLLIDEAIAMDKLGKV